MLKAAVPAHDSRRSAKVTLRVVVLLSIILSAVLAISFAFSEKGISDLQRSRKRVAALQSDIARLEKENARLAAEIQSLDRSTFVVERIAREDLSMSRPGEVIYLLP